MYYLKIKIVNRAEEELGLQLKAVLKKIANAVNKLFASLKESFEEVK